MLANFSTRHGITFPLLADIGSATITRYGILNTIVDEGLGPNRNDPALLDELHRYVARSGSAERFKGMAFPGTFMLDRQGRVTSRFFEDYYWERNTVSNIMLRLGDSGVPVQGTQVSTAHLDLNTYVSDASVAPGTKFSVVLDIIPKPGIHVYAPGATGYRVIALNIEPQPYVRTLPLAFPESEIYHFVPLDERVPVYQRPFTITQEIVPDAAPEAQKVFAGRKELVIAGTLEYQACDDAVCFNPVSVPLSWKVGMEVLVPAAPKP